MGLIANEIKEKIESVESLMNSNSYEKARDLLLDIIDFFNANGDFEKRDYFLLKINECYRVLAQQLQDQKDYFDAAEIYSTAAFLQKQYDKTGLAKQLFEEGIDCYISAGNAALAKKAYYDASTLYLSAANYAKNEIHDKSQAYDYYHMAIKAMQAEIAQFEELPDLCRTNLDLGKIYEQLEDHQTALSYYQKVVECSIQHKLFVYAAESYQHMATCHEVLGNNFAMVENLNEAVQYRLLDAEKHSKNDLPLEAVQNFIAAAKCVAQLNNNDQLMRNILQNEANCFLTAAKYNEEKGKILQAAYFENDAAHCYNQLGDSETSIDLLLTAAEKLLAIDEYHGAADNFQEISIYQEQVGNYIKAANYALEAGDLARESGEPDLELAIENYKRAAHFYEAVGNLEKTILSYKLVAESYAKLAELGLESHNFHLIAFLYYNAACFYSKSNDLTKTNTFYEKAIENYEKAIKIALNDDEILLASYSACCASLVCLIMQKPSRAEVILKNIRNSSPTNYDELSDIVIRAYKMRNHKEYEEIHLKFSKIIKSSLEIKNLLDSTEKSFITPH
jgi:tetratricopeptide (TPR) repeat protein